MSPRISSPTARSRTAWKLRPADPALCGTIAHKFNLHPAVSRILAARGWNCGDDSLTPFLSPLLKHLRSPFELSDMDRAVERTMRAVKAKEKICVYGDYDVDGVTATALLVGTLRFLGVEPRICIPHRLNDGYGMNLARVEEIAAAGCTLIVTVDTGVGAVEPISRAAELGVDVVVTDHHLAGEELPAAVAFVNPNRPDAIYEHARLCGVGVAFKFAHALLKQSGKPDGEAKAFLMEQLDLVALGTIADVVPLMGENRIFVRHGLEAILKSRRPGLRALIEVAGYAGRAATPEMVGYGLGPRLNAAGRTQDATLALKLLLTTDQAEGVAIARQLDGLNRERQEIERAILDASVAEVEAKLRELMPHAIVVGGEGWHLGVVGIVAARLTERYDLPAIVLTIDGDHAKGSARSVPGYDLHEALHACGKHLVSFGGHAGAAGLRLLVSALPDFRAALNEHAAGVFSRGERVRTVEVDAEVTGSDVCRAFYDDLQRLQPFGEGNPEPVLLLRGVESVTAPRIVGNGHLKLRVRAGGCVLDGIGFGLAHLKEIFEGGPADVLFRPTENTWQGVTKLELGLVDGRRAG